MGRRWTRLLLLSMKIHSPTHPSTHLNTGLYKNASSIPQPVACLKGGEEGWEEGWMGKVLGKKKKKEEEEEEWTRAVWGEEACVLELLKVVAALYGEEARAAHLGRWGGWVGALGWLGG